LKTGCYISSLAFISLLLLIQIPLAIPSTESAGGFKVNKIAYIDRDLINYDIIKDIVEKLNMTADFIDPNKIHNYDLRNYDLIAIGPLAFDFWHETGLSKEQIMRIVNAGKPLLLIGDGPAIIPYLIFGKGYVEFYKLPSYLHTAHGPADKHIFVPTNLKLLSYPFKIDIKRIYGFNQVGYIKVYETSIALATHAYIGRELSGMIIGVETYDVPYTTIIIYKDNKICYALWGYDQLYGITLDGKKLLANIIYWLIYNSHEYENNYLSVSNLFGYVLDFKYITTEYKWTSKHHWGYDTISTIWGLAMSVNGSYLIVGDILKEKSKGSVKIYNKNGELLYYKELDDVVWEVDSDSEGKIFIAADGKGNLLLLLRNQDNFLEKIIKLEKEVVTKGLSLGSNGSSLFIGTRDGYLYVFKINIIDENELILEKINELKLGDDRILVSVASYSNLGVAATGITGVAAKKNGYIFLISADGDIISSTSINDAIDALSISPEGDYVAVGTVNGHVMLFDSKLRLKWDYDISKNLTSDIDNRVWSVKVSLKGAYVAAASVNGYAYIFDGATGKPLIILRTNLATQRGGGLLGAWTIDISQDGKYAVVGAAEGWGDAYILARVGNKWEVAMGINTWEAVRKVRLSPDGKYVAVGTVDPYATYRRRGLPGLLFYESPILRVLLDIRNARWSLERTHGSEPCEPSWGWGGTWCRAGENVTVKVYPFLEYANGTRKVFTSWSGDINSLEPKITIVVNSPMTIIANWKTQYYVKVYSEYGNPQGEGWYDKGAIATVTISTTKIEGIPYDKVFKGWRDQSGNIVSTSPTYTFTVNHPVTLTAVWEQVPSKTAVEEQVPSKTAVEEQVPSKTAVVVLTIAILIALLTIIVVKIRKLWRRSS